MTVDPRQVAAADVTITGTVDPGGGFSIIGTVDGTEVARTWCHGDPPAWVVVAYLGPIRTQTIGGFDIARRFDADTDAARHAAHQAVFGDRYRVLALNPVTGTYALDPVPDGFTPPLSILTDPDPGRFS